MAPGPAGPGPNFIPKAGPSPGATGPGPGSRGPRAPGPVWVQNWAELYTEKEPLARSDSDHSPEED